MRRFKDFLFANLVLVFISSIASCVENGDSCNLHYSTVWSFPYGSAAPFLSPPLICHLDGDSLYDIVAMLSSGEVFGISGQSGEVLNNWPLYINESEFLSSPLLFDFNRDGLDDIVLVSEDGKVHFVSSMGEIFNGESFQIPNLAFERYWYETDLEELNQLYDYYSNFYIYEHNTIFHPNTNIDTQKFGIDPGNSSIIYLQPHVHTTPLLEYLTFDDHSHSLFIPLSFYIVPVTDRDIPGLRIDDLNNYSVEAIIILDLFLKTIVNFKIISICKMDSKNPSLILSTPTVLNMLENSDRSLILTSTSGDIFKFSLPELSLVNNFPINTGSPISDAPIVFDNDGDGKLELFVVNEETDIVCFDYAGRKIWSLSLGMKLPPGGGIRIVDIQGPTLITATSDGLLYAINPMTGDILQNYPISTQVNLTAVPILVTVSANLDPVWVILSNHGDLVVHSGKTHCTSVMKGDHSFISTNSLLYHKLLGLPGMELIVTSSEGFLSVLSLNIENSIEVETNLISNPREYQMIGHMQNVQRNLTISVHLTSLSASNSIISFYKQIIMNSYSIRYIINDNSIMKTFSDAYWIKGNVGGITLFSHSYLTTGTYSDDFDIPFIELQTTFTLFIRNKHGLYDYFQFPISFNNYWKKFLKWLLVIPFIGMNIILIFLHLETDHYLPRYTPTK